MNLAFGALLSILLLAPGFAFRLSYLRTEALRRVIDTTLAVEAIIITLSAMVFHALGSLLYLLPYTWTRIDLGQLYLLLIGSDELTLFTASSPPLLLGRFLLYTILLSFMAGMIGWGLQTLVMRFDWDQKYPLLRISNHWELLLTGRMLDRQNRQSLEMISLEVLCSMEGNDRLYRGILEKFTLDKEEGVSKLILSSTEIVYPSRDGTTVQVDVSGSYFVIPFGQVRNVNVIYLKMKREETTTETPQPPPSNP